MPDERKVICPWCGRRMYYQREIDENIGYYNCNFCGARSPVASTASEAYRFAFQTPPNLPLILKDMTECDESDAVWVVSRDGNVAVVNGLDALEYAGYEYDALFFASKPTPADIEAARKERVSQ